MLIDLTRALEGTSADFRQVVREIGLRIPKFEEGGHSQPNCLSLRTIPRLLEGVFDAIERMVTDHLKRDGVLWSIKVSPRQWAVPSLTEQLFASGTWRVNEGFRVCSNELSRLGHRADMEGLFRHDIVDFGNLGPVANIEIRYDGSPVPDEQLPTSIDENRPFDTMGGEGHTIRFWYSYIGGTGVKPEKCYHDDLHLMRDRRRLGFSAWMRARASLRRVKHIPHLNPCTLKSQLVRPRLKWPYFSRHNINALDWRTLVEMTVTQLDTVSPTSVCPLHKQWIRSYLRSETPLQKHSRLIVCQPPKPCFPWRLGSSDRLAFTETDFKSAFVESPYVFVPYIPLQSTTLEGPSPLGNALRSIHHRELFEGIAQRHAPSLAPPGEYAQQRTPDQFQSEYMASFADADPEPSNPEPPRRAVSFSETNRTWRVSTGRASILSEW